MMPPPLPEEVLDLRHVRAAGDVLDRLVVNAQHGRTDERLAVKVSQLHLHLRGGAGFVLVLTRLHGDVEHTLLRRDDDLTHLLMQLSVGDLQCLNKKVRHVALYDVDLFDVAFAVEPDQLRRQTNPIRRSHEQQHRAVGLVGIDQQFDLLTRRVLAFLGDEFEIVEPELAPIKALAAHDEEVATFTNMLFLANGGR